MNKIKLIFAALFVLVFCGFIFAKEHPSPSKFSAFILHKSSQLSKTNQSEHFNCIRHPSEISFYIAKTAKPLQTFDPVEIKEGCCVSFLRKTTQELDLSYQFIRLNILSSQAHPPTTFSPL